MAELILLNGPPGIGKSTLARLFADRHPGTLNLDIDQVRCLIGGWEKDFQSAGDLARPLAASMAATHLASGRSVIVPQFLEASEEIAGFEDIAEETGSTFREVVLMDSKEHSVTRFGERGGDKDPWHGQVKAIVERGGGTRLLEAMYDGLVGGLRRRPSALLIESTPGAVEATYENLLAVLDAAGARRSWTSACTE